MAFSVRRSSLGLTLGMFGMKSWLLDLKSDCATPDARQLGQIE